MAQVQTVRGPIALDDMGRTLIHEHVLFQFRPERRQESIQVAVGMLRVAQEAGMQTIVCLTPFREITWYREINAQVDVHIMGLRLFMSY